jgi:hypothetical protein
MAPVLLVLHVVLVITSTIMNTKEFKLVQQVLRRTTGMHSGAPMQLVITLLEQHDNKAIAAMPRWSELRLSALRASACLIVQ